MGVTGSTGPVMDRDEVDRALARLGAEHEAIETSLLALQDHAGRRLLEGAELTGVTRERWTSTEASITLLWTYFDAYTDALRSARDNLDRAWRGEDVFERFAAGLGRVLAPDGYALLTLSTDGDCDELLAELEAAGFSREIVERTDLINEVVTVYAVRRRA